MRRRRYLSTFAAATGGVAGLGGLAGCSSSQHGDGIDFQNGGFEDGLAHWVPRSDVPEDPNTGKPVAHSVTASPAQASTGASSVELFVDGRQDDGTIWVQQQAALADVETLAVDVYSPEESFNTITKVAAYAGPNPSKPLTEADFDTERAVEDHAGWKTYEYPIDHDASGLVAVGISVVWETRVTRYVDTVRLR